jgi:uncharacterized repeat protein (TIGR01451 family)
MEVFLEDILPDQVDFIGASDGGVKPMGNSSVEWPEFTLMSGETVTRLVTVTVDSPVQADAFFITNRVTVDGHNSERVTAEDKNTLIAAPDLAISKTDGLTAVLPSQLVTYTLLISNIGNQDATGIAVIDDLPNNTSFKWANPESVFNETERVLTWTVNLLMAGESRVLTATVQVDDSMLINPLLITNTAMLTDYGVNGFDQDPINNTTADTDTIFPLPEALTSIKYANLDPVAAGERLTYIIVITNMSEINVTGLQIYDPLPAHTVFIPDSIDLYPPDAGDIGTEPPLLVDNLAIAAGQSVMVWHVVTVSKPLTNGLMINNTAKVTGIQAMVSMTSTISASPLVKIGVDGPESITAGQKATFVFTVTNIGSTWFEVDEIRDDLETRIYPVGGDDCSKDHCRDSWLDLEEAWVFTTSHTFDMPGRQTITGIVAVTDPTGVNETAEDSYSFNVVPPPSTISLIYLPVIFKDFTSAPDLIVESLLADVDLVTITVKNVGNSPVNNGFYVDIYVDPDPIPTGPEHTANDGRSDQYATWLIPSATEVLPLEVGEELTLIIGGDFYKSEYSNFLGNISVGTPIYAQVDSGSPPNGYVLELDENNIFGPVSVTLVAVEQEILPLILPESYTSSFDIKNDIRPRPRP